MKPIAIVTLFTFVLALSGAAWAQEAPPEPQIPPVSSPGEAVDFPVVEPPGEASEGPAVVPLKKGASAPFLGLLVPEARFVELLEAENKARELAAKLAAADRTAILIEQVYLTKLEQAAIVHWYDSPSFNRWLGIVMGAGLAAVAVWGAGELNGSK